MTADYSDLKISVITISFNEAWSLVKTARSVASQDYQNIEYIIVDGKSEDGSLEFCRFLHDNSIAAKFVHEKDSGIYDAMSKGIRMATGDYICFMNSGDTFANSNTLTTVARQIGLLRPDCLIGWGTVGKQIWATWLADIPAVRMSSLGFCHQALFIRRELAQKTPFRDNSTSDNDTYQFADMISMGARIEIIQDIVAIRDPNPGLSAYSAKSTASIEKTLTEYYEFNQDEAQAIIRFRREVKPVSDILKLLKGEAKGDRSRERRLHLAILCLDTLCLKQANSLSKKDRELITSLSLEAIRLTNGPLEATRILALLDRALKRKLELLEAHDQDYKALGEKTQQLRSKYFPKEGEKKVAAFVKDPPESHVCITSFPERIRGLDLVVQSLLKQSAPPPRITIILGSNEFPSINYLPSQLRELLGDVVQVHFNDQTKHNYDKLYATIQGKYAIICDDDVIYRPKCIEMLITHAERNPGCVIANRAHEIKLDSSSKRILPYKEWPKEVVNNHPCHSVFPTGAGGVLYDSSFFTGAAVTSYRDILRYAPFADDIWLKVLSIMNNIKAATTDACLDSAGWYYQYTPQMTKAALHHVNIGKSLNDIQMQSCIDYAISKNADVISRLREGQN